MSFKDEIFKQDLRKRFEFDHNVASVFDDMAQRSIPFYTKVLEICCDFCLFLASGKDNFRVLDLGFATGNFLINLVQKFQKTFESRPRSDVLGQEEKFSYELFGIDSSEAMVNLACQKSQAYGLDISFLHGDFIEYDFQKLSKNSNTEFDVISALWTIQFVRPIMREKLLAKIYENLRLGGVFIMSKKLCSKDSLLDFWIISEYENFKKKQGYNVNEISKKRQALQNALVSYSMEENIQMMQNVGFSAVEVVFCHLNFATFIAKK